MHAVLTGDIVDSSALTGAELNVTVFNLTLALSQMKEWIGPFGFAQRAGDSWQVALRSSRHSLRVALLIRAHLRRHDGDRTTRIAVAEADGALPEGALRDPNKAHGPAFTASGRLLETLSDPVHMAHASGGALDATWILADRIAAGWTQAQARALCEMLPPDPGPRSAAASRLGISRQAVDQALHAAGFPALEAALTALETE